MSLDSDYLGKYLQLGYYNYLDSVGEDPGDGEIAVDRMKREESNTIKNTFCYIFYILELVTNHGIPFIVLL